MTAATERPLVTMAEFDTIFESVKNWGRWGPDDQLGTLNYITPAHVREAAGLVRSGRKVSMEIPINTVAGPDNPNPAIHFVTQAHDIDIDSNGLRFGLDYPRDGLPRRLPHPRRRPVPHLVQGPDLRRQARPGGPDLEGRDDPRHHQLRHRPRRPRRPPRPPALPRREVARARRGRDPGRARGLRAGRGRPSSARATSSSSGPATTGAGSSSGPGTTATRRARARPASTSTPSRGCTSGGSPRSCPTATARPSRAPSRGCSTRSIPLQIVAMGMLASDSLQFEDLAKACEEEGRFEFMVVGLPLRLPGGTGSPWNPIAIF